MANRKNFGTSLVATAPSPATSGTSLVVTAGHGARFPAAPFYATVHPEGSLPTLDNSEVVYVTAKSTDTFTITRAKKETTSAISIAVGMRISNAVYAEDVPGDDALAAWVSWTPTLSAALGTFTLGNGTIVARYEEMGKACDFRIAITLGSTSSMPTLQPRFSLPVTATTYGGAASTPIGMLHLEDTGVDNAYGDIEMLNTTTAIMFPWTANTTYVKLGNITPTVPWTWGSTDQLLGTGRYEKA